MHRNYARKKFCEMADHLDYVANRLKEEAEVLRKISHSLYDHSLSASRDTLELASERLKSLELGKVHTDVRDLHSEIRVRRDGLSARLKYEYR